MVRSSGIPRGRAILGITRVISARTSSTVISRPTDTVGSMGETTTSTADHTENIWLFSPRESVTQEIAGERVNGELGGLAIDGVDVQKDDRVTHGGVEYEVDSVIGYPEDNDADGSTHSDTDFFVISFVRRST